MYHIFNEETLTYEKINFKKFMFYLVGIVLALSLFISTGVISVANNPKYISEETKAIILREADKENEFSPEKLKAYILELNIRFPHIVLAQSQIETGNYGSNIFKENHNLFGMKVATRRPTTNKGEENGHAYYEDWKESVVDYAFYSAQYLSEIKTEKEYLEYLSKSYAEDPDYVKKIKQILSK